MHAAAREMYAVADQAVSADCHEFSEDTYVRMPACLLELAFRDGSSILNACLLTDRAYYLRVRLPCAASAGLLSVAVQRVA